MAFDGRVLNGIGVLAAVVETTSFVRAAAALGMTQSGVSRAIARLEERVGVRLLQRSARAVSLTDEGRRFYEAVAPLMEGIEDAASEAGSASKKPQGLLRVAIDSLVARALIGPRVTKLLADNPKLVIDLVVRDHLGDLVADGIDVAVRFGEPQPSTLITRKLLETRVVTVASPIYLARAGKPSHPGDLAHHECILFRDPRTGRPYEWIFQRGKKTVEVAVKGRLIVNDSATALAACVAGHGIAQPLELELRSLGDVGLVELFPNWPDERFPLYAYYPSRRLPSAKIRALIDFVIAASR
jgi:DNA-binding transcriptional LysR family regulator